MRKRTGGLLAAASLAALAGCEPVGVTAGAEYRYHDEFWYDDNHRARVPRPDRPERPDHPVRPERPHPPATTLPARPGGGGGHFGGGGHGRR